MKKLIAIDLDGTLLSSNIDISEENVQAIQNAQKAGHIVMICSGRAPEDIKTVIGKTPLQCPVAGSNGAMVLADGKLLSQISINKETVKKVAAVLDEYKYPFKIYTSQGIFIASSWTERMLVFLEENKEITKNLTPKEYKLMTEQPKETESIKIFDQLEAVLKIENIAIQKFFVPTLAGKTELTARLKAFEGISITTSGPFNIEVMDTNGNKANGIQVMAEYFNIPIENTVAIGDNFNDVPMLEVAGLSVAMGNADPTVKDLADVVTLTNNEHGVAHAIEKYVLAAK
ncbi:Cof-type HAD-IIB family hydrolase [Metabacillus sediminilitoris]|uniref:HAD family phosphatase n=1 Tax=Metabacillus sediminilitoris TaxID=2567941 RepID=A0A4V3WFI8_9BACI|nr:Cof-type HAD-IIB family hydrolase [Metabacillus sediminilitoris]QGQ44485.1 Cof-type HAD-IIB family hydrolase [Metabacillus sediminilitoris]THF80108.1 HAD family phosphatase [Metabacillus sediminilitoris]